VVSDYLKTEIEKHQETVAEAARIAASSQQQQQQGAESNGVGGVSKMEVSSHNPEKWF
jgi:hypothetical protein